jgi:hypothetical protein
MIKNSVDALERARDAGIAAALATFNTGRNPIKATPFIWRATSDVPLREFLYGKHLIRGYITADVAPGGVGKSTQVITDALAMITGRMLLGDEPAEQLRVWLWNGEDPRDEIERRIAAACAFYGIDAAAIGDRLFVDSGRENELVVLTEDRKGIAVAHPVVEAIKDTIRENEIDVFIVDPFVTTHAVPENDNTKIAAVANQWAQIADDCRCAVQIVHHVRKGDGRELTVEDARGAGSLVNAARTVRVLNPMSEDEATSSGVPRADRFQYFRVTNGKSNLIPRSEHAVWRRLVSQAMDNGDGLARPQDHVGVVTRWEWPSAASMAELPAGALDVIKARIRGGDFRENVQAGDWAGHVVAEVLGIEVDTKAEKKRVSAILKALIKAGHFEVVVRPDAHRMVKKYIVAK